MQNLTFSWSAGPLLVLFAVVSPLGAHAQAPESIRVRVPPGRIEAQSGGAWKTALVVTNDGRTAVRITPRVQLPSGWRPLLAQEVIDVPAGESSLLLLSAVLPPTASEASHPIIVELQSDRGVIVARDTVVVLVPKRRALRISGGAGPRFARLDTSITIDFVVRNEGNVAMTVDLRAAAVNADAAVRDSSRMTLSAGDVRYAAVIVGPTSRPGAQVIELSARMSGGPTFTGAFEALRVDEAPGKRVVLPLTLRVRASENVVTPSEISGGIAGRRDTFELMLRRPGGTGTAFGERDEYRARWSGNHGQIIAGDMVSAAGPIRESYEPLTGIDVTARVGRVTANTYAGRDRLLQTDAAELGASVAIRAMSGLLLGVGGFQRTGPDSGGGPAVRAFSSIGKNPLLPLLRAELNSGKDGITAYGVRAQHRGARTWVDVGFADIGAETPARERGSSRATASIGARLTRLLQIRAWGSQYEMDTLPLRLFAFNSKSYAAGLSYGPLSAEYRHDEREAVIHGTGYASNEESARTYLGHAFGRATVTVGAEVGRSYDPTVSEAKAPFQRFTGSAHLRRTSWWSTGASLEYYSRKAEVTTEHYSGTLSASARVRNTKAEVDASVFHVLFPTVASYSTWNASLSHALGQTGQTVALRARGFSTTAGTSLPQPVVFFVEYGVPFRMRLPGLGGPQVRARVVEAGSGRSVPGALIRMGDFTAITNREGRVTFAPTEMLNALSVERPNASAPLVVDASQLAEAMAGKRRDVTIAVGEGARVLGRVSRYDRVTRDSLAPAGGIANVEVTLSRGADSVRAVTKEDGRFDFRQLPPGNWKVSVQGGQVPAAYGFERSSTTVVVEPGSSASVEFRVVMLTTEVNLQDGGSLSVPKPQPPPRQDRQPRPPRR